jgi:hypothetical protein
VVNLGPAAGQVNIWQNAASIGQIADDPFWKATPKRD